MFFDQSYAEGTEKEGITQGVSVVYSTEQITRCVDNPVSRIPGSISFVPSVAGLFWQQK